MFDQLLNDTETEIGWGCGTHFGVILMELFAMTTRFRLNSDALVKLNLSKATTAHNFVSANFPIRSNDTLTDTTAPNNNLIFFKFNLNNEREMKKTT